MLELALLAPWIFFLFAGALDMGYYCSAAISVENAARVAALRLSTSASVAGDPNAANIARGVVCNELKTLPNVGAACPTSIVQVNVPAQPFNGSDGSPAAQVSVTYTTVQLIPIPGLSANGNGQWTFTRTVQMRL